MRPVLHPIHVVAPKPSRGPDGDAPLRVQTDPDELSLVNMDAAAMRGAGAAGLVEPRSEAQLGAWLRDNPDAPVLVQGALTSLTGGATPQRDIVVSTRRLTSLEIHPEGRTAICGAGVVLATLQAELANHGLWYPPAPTHDGATIGGNVATNAAGAATFKYGSTRDWVTRIRMMLRNGDVIELRRGQVQVAGGDVVRVLGSRTFEFVVPSYRTPDVRKISAGYYVRSPMDLIDLLVGAEGTLGIVTEVELRVDARPQVVTGLVFFGEVEKAIAFVLEMRRASVESRKAGARLGLDARSIEFFDRRCLSLLRDTGKLSEYGVNVPDGAEVCLLFELEVPPHTKSEDLIDDLACASEGRGGSDLAARLMGMLASFGVVETCELAMPDQVRRQRQLSSVREAIPLGLSEWLKQQKKQDPAVHKVGGDMIVPMDRFEIMFGRYYEAFRARGVDVAVFGHISDGNVHPNGLPTSAVQVELAKEALLELAQEAKRLGGSPLSEHGVGRHPLKRAMLEAFWGKAAIAEMKTIKRAFDPGWTLNRGVLFDPGSAEPGMEQDR
jgi:D-lactate dehydrogenase (cytochrome)